MLVITCWPINLERKDQVGYLGVDGRVISKRVFEKQRVSVWTTFKWHKTGLNGGIL